MNQTLKKVTKWTAVVLLWMLRIFFILLLLLSLLAFISFLMEPADNPYCDYPPDETVEGNRWIWGRNSAVFAAFLGFIWWVTAKALKAVKSC